MKFASSLHPRTFSILFLVALAAASHSARAQSSAADRARLLQSQGTLQTPAGVSAEGVDQNYAAASPNDPDLGEQEILKRVEKYKPFTIDVGTPIYYTSNVALVNRGAVGDVIIAPVVALTYAPQFRRTLYGEFIVRQQFFYYGKYTGFNFASFDAIAGLAYYVPNLNNLVLRADLNYNRLTGPNTFDAFFSNYALWLSAEMPFRIGRAQQVSFGTSANISLYAYPQEPRRNDFGVFAGYTANLSRSFSLSAAGQVVVRPYDSGGRTDVSEILALSANYRIKEWLTLSAVSTFVANQSNRSTFDYQLFNIGGGISLSWRF
jgi:hypothetical protein